MDLQFKDNISAFEYACKYLDCKVAAGVMLPAVVQDGRSLFGTQESVTITSDGIQTAVLKIASSDGELSCCREDAWMRATTQTG